MRPLQDAIQFGNSNHGEQAVPHEYLQLLLAHLFLHNQVIGFDSILCSELRKQGPHLPSEIAVVLLPVPDIVLHFPLELVIPQNSGNEAVKLLLYRLIFSLNPADHLLPVLGGQPQVPLLFFDGTVGPDDLFRAESQGLVELLSLVDVSLVDEVGASIPIKHLELARLGNRFISHAA